MRMPSPDGKMISHAEIKIGDSIIFLSDEFPQHGGKSPQTLGGFTGGIYLYVKDVDGVFEKAVAAGGKVRHAGERHVLGRPTRQLHRSVRPLLGISTHTEDLSEEEMGKRAQAFYAEMSNSKRNRLALPKAFNRTGR